MPIGFIIAFCVIGIYLVLLGLDIFLSHDMR